MNADLFEQLLYEEESDCLDFKADQYRFAGATDDEKAEILKDILGFANAWRRAKAYILVGVRDVRGGRSIIEGISDHLDDHSLQQFVNSKTNAPVRFRYRAFGVEGKQVGIIEIDEQPRPLYLTKRFAWLDQNAVYVRRGSSIDHTRPASPSEIAGMAKVGPAQETEINVQFGEGFDDKVIGESARFSVQWLRFSEQIPDYRTRRHGIPLAIEHPYTNRDYLRQYANYVAYRDLACPVRLIAENVSNTVAQSPLVELSVADDDGLGILYEHQLPTKPKKKIDIDQSSRFHQAAKGVMLSRSMGIEKTQHGFRLSYHCDDIQPGRKLWSPVLCFVSPNSRVLVLDGQVYANNLPQPRPVSLSIEIAVGTITTSIERLREIAAKDAV